MFLRRFLSFLLGISFCSIVSAMQLDLHNKIGIRVSAAQIVEVTDSRHVSQCKVINKGSEIQCGLLQAQSPVLVQLQSSSSLINVYRQSGDDIFRVKNYHFSPSCAPDEFGDYDCDLVQWSRLL